MIVQYLQSIYGDKVNINNNTEFAELCGHMLDYLIREIERACFEYDTLCVYNSKTTTYMQQLANMFDIDIQGEPRIVQETLLELPIFAKAYRGSIGGIVKALESILYNMEIKTHANTPGMMPYTYVVQADNKAGLSQDKAISLINRFACLRDNAPELVLTEIACSDPYFLVSVSVTRVVETVYFSPEGVCHGREQSASTEPSE